MREAFVAPIANAAAAGRGADSAKCGRRAVLRLGLLAATAAHLPARVSAEGNLSSVDARAKVTGEATLAQFVALLERGDVKGAWFYGSFADYCCFVDKDGVFRHIGEGYPVESSRSPESPRHVMARLRETGVPYYVAPPIDRRFLRATDS